MFLFNSSSPYLRLTFGGCGGFCIVAAVLKSEMISMFSTAVLGETLKLWFFFILQNFWPAGYFDKEFVPHLCHSVPHIAKSVNKYFIFTFFWGEVSVVSSVAPGRDSPRWLESSIKIKQKICFHICIWICTFFLRSCVFVLVSGRVGGRCVSVGWRTNPPLKRGPVSLSSVNLPPCLLLFLSTMGRLFVRPGQKGNVTFIFKNLIFPQHFL